MLEEVSSVSGIGILLLVSVTEIGMLNVEIFVANDKMFLSNTCNSVIKCGVLRGVKLLSSILWCTIRVGKNLMD